MYTDQLQQVMKQLGTLPMKEVEIKLEGEEEAMPIQFFSEEDVLEEQAGYRHDEEGHSFVNGQEGDWQESWFVIGCDEYTGDPFFIALDNPQYPVYTAEHGVRVWKPVLVAHSLDQFLAQLTVL